MTDTKQPEALRLAEYFGKFWGKNDDEYKAAAELRRLHEENETLKKCLFQMLNAAIELAKPEQVITPISPDQYERFCGTCGACTGKPWVGLTEGELIDIQNCNRGFWVNAAKIEQLLKDKNI